MRIIVMDRCFMYKVVTFATWIVRDHRKIRTGSMDLMIRGLRATSILNRITRKIRRFSL